MRLEQRTLITKDMVRHTLATSAKRYTALISLVFVPVLIVFSLFAIVVVPDSFFWIIPSIFAVLYVIVLLCSFLSYRRAQNAAFRFRKDTVQGIAEDDHIVYGYGHRRAESSIYFSWYGRAVIARREIPLYSVGDECLLVIADNRKEEILSYYNLKYYRTEEWDG